MITIEPSISQILEHFQETWAKRVDEVPQLQLDSTWPSSGTIDLFTFGLRLQKSHSNESRALLRGSAAYLASIIASAWNAVAEEVRVSLSSEEGIVVRARGGEFLPENEEMRLPIESALTEVLQTLPDPFPILRSAERRISFDSNVVSLLSIGCAFGLSPYVQGPWEQLSFKDLRRPLQEISKEFAKQTADFYARVYPDEPLGSVAELYLSSLIFPPLFVGEPLPGKHAVANVVEFCKKYNVSKTQLATLARNWALLPDNNLSTIGLIFYAATAEGPATPELIAAAQSKASSTGLLRESVISARRALSEEAIEDWAVSGISTPEQELHFELDQDLLLTPWLVLPAERFSDAASHKRLNPLLLALCAFEYEEAVRECDALLEEQPDDIELRVQRIKLEMLNGDWEKVDTMFRSLISEPGADENPLLFHFWTLTALAQGNSSAALKYSRAGLAVVEKDSKLRAELLNNSGWSELLADGLEQALELFEEGLRCSNCPLTLLLNKAHALWRSKRHKEAAKVREELIALAPFDRRVFVSIIAGSTQQQATQLQ